MRLSREQKVYGTLLIYGNVQRISVVVEISSIKTNSFRRLILLRL